MLGNTSLPWAVLVLYSAVLCRRHCHWCLVLTVGSFVHGFTAAVAGDTSRVHDGGDRGAAPWAATSGRDENPLEREAQVYEGDAELLVANVPERDLPAYRALQRGVELHVRGREIYSCRLYDWALVL